MFTIYDIISTLNNIEVKGKDNLDRLLGVIMALESIANTQSKEETKEEEKVTDNG